MLDTSAHIFSCSSYRLVLRRDAASIVGKEAACEINTRYCKFPTWEANSVVGKALVPILTVGC
jgi:hypothetical protein